MAVSNRSNPSLARFWGFVLAFMFYGFVMVGLLGFPAHRTGAPLPDPAGTGRAQVAGVPRPESEASASAPVVSPQKAASAQLDSGGTHLAAATPPSLQASPTSVPMIASAAKATAGGPQPENEASTSAPMGAPTEDAANAQPIPGATPLTGAAPPQADTTQMATIASAAKPMAGGPQPESEASAAAPMVTPAGDAAGPGATALAAAALPAPGAVATQLPTVVITAKPVPPAVSRPTLVDVRHRCDDAGWTWQSGACPAHPRPIVWRWVLRGCAIRLGHLCIGPSYAPIRVAGASQRHVWR